MGNNTVVGLVISAYTGAVLISSLLITRTLLLAYYGQPIYLRTRSRNPLRRRDLQTSVVLVALSFGVNLFHVIDAVVTSYSAWAANAQMLIPSNIWTASAWFPFAEKSVELNLARLFGETDWLQEISFAVAGRSRDFWWAQQLSAATIIWSIYLAIEARRRNIPHAWSFVLLAHLVGLSTAQNLFHIVLLLTPLPIEKRTGRSAVRLKLQGSTKPITWTPHPAIFLVAAITAMLSTAAFPYFSNNTSIFVLGAIPVVSTFLPLLITKSNLIPSSWGHDHHSVSSAHAASLPVFAASARVSTTLYLLLTGTSLFYNTPPPRQQDPATLLWSKFLEVTNLGMFDNTALSTAARARIAVTRFFSSLSQNPVMRKIGWDVLLSGLSLCAWAGVRGLDASHVLSAAGIPGVKDIATVAQDLAGTVSSATESAIDTLSTSTADIRATAGATLKQYTDPALETLSTTAKQLTDSAATVTADVQARVTAKAHELADAAIERLGLDPDEVEEEGEEIAEGAKRVSRRAASKVSEAASGVANSSTTKRAGRASAKAASAAADAAQDAASSVTSSAKAATSQARKRVAKATSGTSSTGRSQVSKKSRSNANADDDDSDSDEDDDYQPSPRDARADSSEQEHELSVGSNEDAAESVALAWGLAIVGGLGTAAAGVWGADLVVR